MVDQSPEGPLAVAGAQPSLAPQTGSAAPVQDTANPYDSFNLLMTDLLKNAQGLNTADLLKKKRALEREALDRTGKVTPADRRTLSPEQQNAIRSGSVRALSGEFDQNAYELEKAEQAIDSFFRTYSEASKLGAEFAEKMVAPDSVIENAKKIIESDPSKLSSVLAGFNDKSKEKILGSLDYSRLEKKPDPNVIIDNERALFGQFRSEPIVKNYNEVLNKKLSVDAIVDKGVGGPADLALVFEFMKALDPTSVVRESEYDAAAKSGNIFAGAFARFNGYLRPEGGILPEAVRDQFQSLVNEKLTVSQRLYDNVAQQYADIARRQGLDPQNVVLDFAAAADGQQPERRTINGVEYEKVEGGWQKVSTAGNRPQRNNNPLNIKSSEITSQYPGVTGVDPEAAEDGGQFLTFETPEAGLAAAQRLLKSEGYRGLTVEAAMRRWSNNGYGGEVAPDLSNRVISSLSADELSQLIDAMARREGYYA